MSPALAGGFLTTGPPAKPQLLKLLRLSLTSPPPSLSDRKSLILSNLIMCFPSGSNGKESAYNEEGHSKPVLWDNPEGWGWEGGGRGVQDRGDRCAPVADSCQCTAKAITLLSSNYHPIKLINILNK